MKPAILTAAAILLLAGPALADPNPNSETTGNPGNGNQGCTLNHPATEEMPNGFELNFKNPGKLIQAIREAHGWNPKQAVEQGGGTTVGEGINDACGADPS